MSHDVEDLALKILYEQDIATVKKKQHPKWFTPAIKHRLNCIHSLRRKYKKKPTDTLKLKLQAEEDNLQALIVEAKSDYESKLISNYASSNNNLIYKYIIIFSYKK